jgi:hypothetical protein
MRTALLILLFVSVLPLQAAGQAVAPDKRALAIIGDFWHAVAPLHRNIVRKMEQKGYRTDVVLDYNVPFDRLADYDLILLSRYAVEDYRTLREGETDYRKYTWLTPEQEAAFETYVLNGGHLFFHHDGIGFYAKGGPVSRLAKAYFLMHPPAVPITVRPSGNYRGLNEGIEPFVIKDEEYALEIDTTATNVFMRSHSPENGHAYQGWAHDYGRGRVVVFVPGHDRYTLIEPMVQRVISNILESFGR